MAPMPTTNTSRPGPHPTRPAMLHSALLLLCCWLLAAQGAESPAKATPLLSRKEREAGCARSCAQTSEMSRCLRMACRKYAMGPLIRFGKRDRGGMGSAAAAAAAAPGDAQLDDGEGSNLNLSPTAIALSSHHHERQEQRKDILENLLSRNQAQRSGYRSRDDDMDQGRQLEVQPDERMQRLMTSLHRQAWPDLDLALARISPQISSLSSPYQYPDVKFEDQRSRAREGEEGEEDQLLLWLLRASRDFRHQRLQQQMADDVSGASFWDAEPSSSSQRSRSLGNNGLVSPLTYPDLSGLLGKRTTSGSGSGRADSITLPAEQMRRHQRGLLKHLIRFG